MGIDDFAWKRGKRYGPVSIDLERHEILDLLPDREADSVQKWLAAHPDIVIVSRDRGGAYADGAARGAPQAEQVADRWHLTSSEHADPAVPSHAATEAGSVRADPRAPVIGPEHPCHRLSASGRTQYGAPLSAPGRGR